MLQSCGILILMKHKLAIFVGGVTMTVSIAMLNFTNPADIGPFGVLIFFVSLYFFITSFLYLVTTFFSSLVSRGLQVAGRRYGEELSPIKNYYLSSVIALAPIIALGVQSVGGIGVFDIGLIILFEIIACFYVVKRF